MSEERFPCFPPIERADYLLVVDLVCIGPLLAFIHRSTRKRCSRDVQYERRVR
jgi:hypothetical protein